MGEEKEVEQVEETAPEATTPETGSEVESEVAESATDTTEAPEQGEGFAYVREVSGDHVIRIAEDKLHIYLLDPRKIPTYDKNGVKIGGAFVGADYPLTLKIDDKSAEAVRGYRASAEETGFSFQFAEATKADWDAQA